MPLLQPNNGIDAEILNLSAHRQFMDAARREDAVDGPGSLALTARGECRLGIAVLQACELRCERRSEFGVALRGSKAQETRRLAANQLHMESHLARASPPKARNRQAEIIESEHTRQSHH
jgi:hypothetical protein